MSSQTFPVFIQQRDGERVRIGSATREADGSFTLQLGELLIGSQPEAARPGRPSAPAPSAGGLPTVFPNYGRSKGAPIRGASQQDLEYYANGARRSLADPSKERFHDKERALLAAIDEELARQGGGGDSGPEEPPPPGDEDIPF